MVHISAVAKEISSKKYTYEIRFEKKKYNVKIIHSEQAIKNILNFISNNGS